jgi:membrane-associated phospholipid phosphatase
MGAAMLLRFGIALLVLGLMSFAVDRRAAHFFYETIHRRWDLRIRSTTDWAKGAYWLAGSALLYALAESAIAISGESPWLLSVSRAALAFLASLAAASAILHSIKIALGRRRPRDEFDFGFYGFQPFHFAMQYDSFPSGHAMTICCVAVILSGTIPVLAPLWFVGALYLALTRAVLNAHFLSDVFIGAGIGVVTSREVVVQLFPLLAPAWF